MYACYDAGNRKPGSASPPRGPRGNNNKQHLIICGIGPLLPNMPGGGGERGGYDTAQAHTTTTTTTTTKRVEEKKKVTRGGTYIHG